ncbi:FecR family protein [Maribacter ulvicola]|uniref:FecR family protein n=1 Tax=Maribacter ulvicola TaxID=228959 RepID=A0A1N6S4Q7_9FLAO|nr:FecR family protein [Maribacter ulvicola]SIQ35997.1 FecR family protein [Maribacter ulvicola]
MEFKLILKKLNNTLTKEEELIFDEWFLESDSHRAYFAQVEKNILKSPDAIDPQKGWEKISSKTNLKPQFVKKDRYGFNYWKYAAAIAAIFILGALPFLMKEKHEVQNTPIIVAEDIINIGTDKATLTLEDGSNIILGKGAHYKANNLSSNGEKLIYKSGSKSSKNTIAYNVLTIPRGGEFFIILADGTKVWLNSETQLRYPVSFTSDQARKVELVYGEAYFEVSSSTEHNGNHFIVSTHEQEIDVLGTEFNINAYKEDAIIKTTLVEGSVLIKSGASSENLLPGQQSQFNMENHEINVAQVDVYNEVSWKSGFFSFKDKPLKEIMLVLSRWYDIEVIIENTHIKNLKFNGVFNKKQNLDDILLIIENTNEAKFETIGKKIIVK